MSERPPAIATQANRTARVRSVETAWFEAPDARRQARGRRVARDLVELSRLQRGDERAQQAQVDLAVFLRQICAGYGQLSIAGPDSLVVSSDPRRLARVLSALLDNAALHGKPPIAVRYDTSEIVIEDSGGGFEPKLLERATEPFVTGSRARGRGIGLGLAIAARQAALLGADLRLNNGPTGGASARLCFRARADAPQPGA
ncbi:MAG: HAMP domain-containing sensor histidine kinase [Solirubrobacteraceae bacterium]|jgi:signal transduction histidine kinase